MSFDFYWLGSTEGYPAFFSVRMLPGGGQDMLINFDLDQTVMIHHYIVKLGDPSMPLYEPTNTKLPQEQWMRVILRIRESEHSAELIVGDFFSKKFSGVPNEFFAEATTPQSIVLGLEYADGPRPNPLELRYDNFVLRALH